MDVKMILGEEPHPSNERGDCIACFCLLIWKTGALVLVYRHLLYRTWVSYQNASILNLAMTHLLGEVGGSFRCCKQVNSITCTSSGSELPIMCPW